MSTTRSQRSRTSATAAFFRPHCAHDARRLPTTAAGPPTDWDGLELRPSKNVDLLYVRPDASLGGYKHDRLAALQVFGAAKGRP